MYEDYFLEAQYEERWESDSDESPAEDWDSYEDDLDAEE